MFLRHTLFALTALSLSLPSQADINICSQMLVETPGSVETRVCFTKELAALNVHMEALVKSIAKQANGGRTAFNSKEFLSAQRKWGDYVSSTCWLDAAGTGNSDAVFQHCTAKYSVQRLTQLKNLQAGLDGESIMWPMSNLDISK
jgi:uncharacterized protein YecT (DUF1311 family)